MVAFTLLSLLASALAAIAAPSAAPGPSSDMVARAGSFPNIPGDNASCQKVIALCGATIADPANASKGWLGKSKECTLSAICYTMYGADYNVDAWLQTQYGPSAPKSQAVSRWPQTVNCGGFGGRKYSGSSICYVLALPDPPRARRHRGHAAVVYRRLL